jgi:hypothetical protein
MHMRKTPDPDPQPSIPQDPEARSLIVGVSVAGYYAISAWSQVLVWPASQAPYYRYGWQSALAILVLVIIMTCVLRFIDVRYLLPRRVAFRAALDGEAVQGIDSESGSVAKDARISREDEDDDERRKEEWKKTQTATVAPIGN